MKCAWAAERFCRKQAGCFDRCGKSGARSHHRSAIAQIGGDIDTPSTAIPDSQRITFRRDIYLRDKAITGLSRAGLGDASS